MRICLVTRSTRLSHGGLARIATELLKGLSAKNNVSVLTMNGNSLYSYFRYTTIEMPFRLPKDADIYHAISPMEAVWLPKKKSVVTITDLFTVLHPNKIGAGMGGSKWKPYVGKLCYDAATHIAIRCGAVVSISEQTKRDLVEHLGLPDDKIKVVRLGIRQDLEPRTSAHHIFTIGYLGQLDRRKRVDLLIKAFRDSKLNARLLVAGRGADEEQLKLLAGRDERIIFVGYVKDEETPDFYNMLDVFVFPTWIEGYGLPIVEAMACKKPVIVLSDAIIPQELKSRCIVTDRLEGIFEHERILTNLHKVNNIESNYAFAKMHDWKRTVEEYMKIYEEVLGG